VEDFEFEFERETREQCKILGGLYWGERADRLAVFWVEMMEKWERKP
jgi:hypothetical protein